MSSGTISSDLTTTIQGSLVFLKAFYIKSHTSWYQQKVTCLCTKMQELLCRRLKAGALWSYGFEFGKLPSVTAKYVQGLESSTRSVWQVPVRAWWRFLTGFGAAFLNMEWGFGQIYWFPQWTWTWRHQRDPLAPSAVNHSYRVGALVALLFVC